MNKRILRFAVLVSSMACVILGISGCGIQGTYKDESGNMTLELKGDGKATFATGGQSTECTYKVDGDKVPVTCRGLTVEFTRQSDGSLTPGRDAAFGSLKKQ